MNAVISAHAPTNENGFAVYVHWPFCLSKCPYCDFNSHVRSDVDEGAYVEMLKRDLAQRAELSGPRVVTSIFFGGGTPSLMKPSSVEKIIEGVASCWATANDIEINLEANPTSVEEKNFAGYKAAGVNRISLGIQSLNDDALKMLGREHSSAEAIKALETAARHFSRYSFDLIYARPEQTDAQWREELLRALSYAGEHLSLYELTLEEGTPFHRAWVSGKLHPLESERAAQLYELTQDICGDVGLEAYEVSNHARKDAECRHNLTYWRYGEYVGVGPGAHGRVVVDGVREAHESVRSPEQWRRAVETQGHGLSMRAALTGPEQAQEYLMMGLRLTEGVCLARFEALCGTALSRERIETLVAQDYLALENGALTVTPNGRLVLNALTGALLT